VSIIIISLVVVSLLAFPARSVVFTMTSFVGAVNAFVGVRLQVFPVVVSCGLVGV